jgi:hypothetical protein
MTRDPRSLHHTSLPDAPSVPRVKIHLLRLLYALMAVFLGVDAWTHILTFRGEWDPAAAAAWTIWASYSILAIPGIFYPLKMLPLVLLEIVYKLIWLVVVAYPLYAADKLNNSPAEEMTHAFLWVALPIVAMPWKYAFHTYVKARPGTAKEARHKLSRNAGLPAPSYSAQ